MGYLLGMSMKKIILALALIALPVIALAAGNTTNDSFNQSKQRKQIVPVHGTSK